MKKQKIFLMYLYIMYKFTFISIQSKYNTIALYVLSVVQVCVYLTDYSWS